MLTKRGVVVVSRMRKTLGICDVGDSLICESVCERVGQCVVSKVGGLGGCLVEGIAVGSEDVWLKE